MRRESQKRRVRERHVKKGGLTASYLEPDQELDLESDLGAIKSSVRSRAVYGGYESGSSDNEEEEGERLLQAKRDEVEDDRGEEFVNGCSLVVLLCVMLFRVGS